MPQSLHTKSLVTSPVRELDPQVLQRKASDPRSSVWVGASAGTGKTKVLTDRVLRLLLPREDEQAGTPPHKILCLTFTKAGAGEMLLRLSGILSDWAAKPDEGLRGDLQNLLGRMPCEGDVKAARKLFTEVIDSQGGLKIMTIHAFCQSVLGRFPLEAGVSPQFTILEESQAVPLLERARNKVLQRAAREKTSSLATALQAVSNMLQEDQFFSLLNNVIGERHQLEHMLREHFGPEGFYAQLCQSLNIPQNLAPESLREDFFRETVFTAEDLRACAGVLLSVKSSTDQKAGAKILAFLDAVPAQKQACYETYKSCFFTTKHEIRKTLVTQDSCKKHPDILHILGQEALRIEALEERIKTVQMARLTRDLFILCDAILQEYSLHKSGVGALDFDDLIFHTLNLLQGRYIDHAAHVSAGWVQYKLDEGLDHILVDEAQDTNPEQWRIIEALCAEFFAGQGAREIERTIFVVGDEKQSIYSFQRASPQDFHRMRKDFAQKIEAAQKTWEIVPMNISFRSTKTVLMAVDAVFAQPLARKGLGETEGNIAHHAFRRGQAGVVELWPLFETDRIQEPDLWNPNPENDAAQTGLQKLSQHMALTIKDWITRGDILESSGRPIKAGDVMILVRTRKNMGIMAAALKKQGIPVSGLDRVILKQDIGIQDLLALGAFVLQPRDDLSLACVLKSPLIGLSEEALYALAQGRGGQSLWERVQAIGSKSLKHYLQMLQHMARQSGPFAFFSNVLQNPCPAEERSGRRAMTARLGVDVTESLDEFLALALQFERQYPPALEAFLHMQARDVTQIKREQDKAHNAVRIMTVHASKGLQAPIVILPDTTASAASGPNKADKRLLWPNQSGQTFPLWSPRKDRDCALYTQGMVTLDERLAEEYRRLLYVAMTRAEDRLYIAGALGKTTLPEVSWYRFVQQGLENLEYIERLENGVLRLSHTQTAAPDKTKIQEPVRVQDVVLPDWIFAQAPCESETSPLVRPSYQAERALSPLQGLEDQRFLRGNLTHKLLEVLPSFPQTQWDKMAETYLGHYAQGLPAEIRRNIQSEVLAILRHPEFSAFFSGAAMAEVPVTGFIAGRGIVQGQIDRLLVTPTDIYIVDFKTNRPPPLTPEDVPEMYRTQMALYSAVLQKIYPERRVHAALLWTDGPLFMKIPL